MSKTDLQKAEALSALMDGEVDEMELHRTLKNVAQDDELRASWHRYHLMSSALRKELPETLVDLSGAISKAIEQEGKPAMMMQRWLKPMGRFAVAASVTVVAVFGVQQYNQSQSGMPTPIAAVDQIDTGLVPVQLPSAFTIPQLPVRTVSATRGGSYNGSKPVVIKQAMPDKATQEQVQRYLNELMLRHTENAALNTNQGMLPFARMPQTQE